MAITATHPRVLADTAGTSFIANVALVLSGATFVGLLAQVRFYLPENPVPVTGQTLAVLLVAAALGSHRGALAMGLYAALGMAGVPWFAGATAGFAFASFGYVLGFIASAWVVGKLAEHGMSRSGVRTGVTMAVGSVVIYAFGASWLAFAFGMGISQAISVGVVPFLLGDVVKLVLAAGLFPAMWKLVTYLTR